MTSGEDTCVEAMIQIHGLEVYGGGVEVFERNHESEASGVTPKGKKCWRRKKPECGGL